MHAFKESSQIYQCKLKYFMDGVIRSIIHSRAANLQQLMQYEEVQTRYIRTRYCWKPSSFAP